MIMKWLYQIHYGRCSNYEFTNRIPFHNVSFGAADHHDDLSLEGDDQHWALVHHLTHRQLQWTNKWNENSTLCWYGYCHLNDILCVNVCQEVKAENWRNHSKYYFGNLQTQENITLCVRWLVYTGETLTSMLSMSRILDWKSSPNALACWIGWASWLYVWGQIQENTFDMKIMRSAVDRQSHSLWRFWFLKGWLWICSPWCIYFELINYVGSNTKLTAS